MSFSSVLRAGQEQGSAQIMENPSLTPALKAKNLQGFVLWRGREDFHQTPVRAKVLWVEEQQQDPGASSSKEGKVHTFHGFSSSSLGWMERGGRIPGLDGAGLGAFLGWMEQDGVGKDGATTGWENSWTRWSGMRTFLGWMEQDGRIPGLDGVGWEHSWAEWIGMGELLGSREQDGRIPGLDGVG